MNFQPSDKFLFQPLVPQWLLTAFEARFIEFTASYRDLLVRNWGSNPLPVSFPNVSVQQVNDYAQTAGAPPGNIVPPWPCRVTDKGGPLQFFYWPISKPPPAGDFDGNYWNAMWFGVVSWQMYYIFVSEQIVRFGEFGHYGRKPE